MTKRITASAPIAVELTDKRSHLLRCALTVFLQYGYSQAAMDKVAALAGCSKQTIYGLFKDKAGLFEAVFTELSARLLEQQDFKQSENMSPEAYLTKIANQFFDVMEREEYASFFRLVIAESGRFPSLAAVYVSSVVEPSAKQLEIYLTARPELNIDDPKAVARAFRGALASFILVQEILHGKKLIPMTKKRFIASAVKMVLGAQKVSSARPAKSRKK